MTGAPDVIRHCEGLIETWLPGAMYPSEIAWFLESFTRAGCEVVVECGRQDGVSTEAFARSFADSPVEVISIDLERDRARAQRARERLRGCAVELVAGDIHVEVPKVLRRCAGKKVAVLQDGAKGWEGLATLLAAATCANVGMVAQHNLHHGHVTRTVFEMLALRPSFVESSDARDRFAPLIEAERAVIRTRNPNRSLDHTSLGVMLTDRPQKKLIVESFRVLKPIFGPWNPARVVAAWGRDDFGYVTRLRRWTRLTPARFKAR